MSVKRRNLDTNMGSDLQHGGFNGKRGRKMTVGEVIALLAQYSSDVDLLLMCRDICSIEVDGNSITVYTTDGNSSDITISAKEE